MVSEFRAALQALVTAFEENPPESIIDPGCYQCSDEMDAGEKAYMCPYHAAYSSAKALLERPEPEPRITRKWQPIDTAPKDGTLLLLLVYIAHSEHPTEQAVVFRTIGHNNLDNDGEDAWKFAGWCWEHDHFTQASGEPISWMPLPSLPSPPAASDGDSSETEKQGE